MNILPEEIDTIEEFGELDGSPVKIIKTKGGFYIAVGKAKNKLKDEALAAGSHPAIVRYNVEKQYPGFQASMMKSEMFAETSIVESHSHFLSDELRKSGHDVFSVQNGNSIDFHITKHNLKVSVVNGKIENDSIVMENMDSPKEFARALAGATVEKAAACNVNKVKIQG